MQLPAAIETYFTTDRGTDAASLIAGFTPAAVVQDDGAEYIGHTEILAWRLASREKYADLVTEPVEQTVNGDRVTVRCKVSGDFLGSPAMLDFAFTLGGGQISKLEIH